MPRKISKKNLILLSIISLFWIGFFMVNFIWKGSYIFEGQLTFKEISFTYNGDLPKPLLQNVLGIRKLDITGRQLQALTLKGSDFTSNDDNLKQKLINLDKIKIEFPYVNSRLILTPKNNLSSNNLSLLELRINPETNVQELTYNKNNILSFCLQSTSKSSGSCLLTGNENNKTSQEKTTNNLKLYLGKEAYIIDLERVNIPDLNITTNSKQYQSLQLQYIAQGQEPQIDMLSPTQIFIDLPKQEVVTTDSEIDVPQWFYEDIEVKDVQFHRFKKPSNNVTDEIPISTIIQGKIRMNDREIKLQANQFLVVTDGKPGIRKLRHLSIHPQNPQGLNTLISGKSKGIAVGLFPQFPIQSINPSWLSKYFSSEAIAAILSFVAAFTAVVLEKILFPDKP